MHMYAPIAPVSTNIKTFGKFKHIAATRMQTNMLNVEAVWIQRESNRITCAIIMCLPKWKMEICLWIFRFRKIVTSLFSRFVMVIMRGKSTGDWNLFMFIHTFRIVCMLHTMHRHTNKGFFFFLHFGRSMKCIQIKCFRNMPVPHKPTILCIYYLVMGEMSHRNIHQHRSPLNDRWKSGRIEAEKPKKPRQEKEDRKSENYARL